MSWRLLGAGAGAGCGGPDRLGPLPAALPAGGAGGHSWRSWSVRCPISAPAPTASGKTQFVERLTNAPVQQRKKLLTDYLRDAVAEVTRVDAAEIREDAGFFDLGMDSLMAVELRRRIEQGVGKEIPVTLVMDHPRLSDVADYLLGDVLGLSEQASDKSAAAAGVSGDDARRTNRSRSSRCRAVSLARPTRRRSGRCCPAVSMRSGRSRRTASTSTSSTTRIQRLPGKTYTRFGGFLDGIDGFDPEFFGISPREAVWIEPQQRLMLETAWEGLERAGYSPAALRGSRTGIFVGVAANEYAHLLSVGVDRQDRAPLHHRQRAQRHLRSGCLRARTRRTGGGGRYRMQLVVGGRPSGLPGIALR